MSFVERNKLWLLPVLALGVAAVGWFNYQSFAGPKPAEAVPAGAAQTSEAAPGEPNPALGPAPGPAQEAPTEASGVWDDLKALAFVPGDLNRLDALDTQARASLPGAALRESPSDLIRLGGPKMWEAEPRSRASLEGPLDTAPIPDILIQLPEGSRVWFDGVSYREKQELDRTPWKVRKIHPKAVELQGPRGTEVKPIHPKSESKEGP